MRRIHSLLGIFYLIPRCHGKRNCSTQLHLLVWQNLDELHAAAVHLVAY